MIIYNHFIFINDKQNIISGTGSSYCSIENCQSECPPTQAPPPIVTLPPTSIRDYNNILIMYIDTWDGNIDPLLISPANVFIFTFLIQTETSGSVNVQPFDAAAKLTFLHVSQLHDAGKKVLISFGGATMGSEEYAYDFIIIFIF